MGEIALDVSARRIKELERESRRESLGRSWYKFSRNPLSVVGLVTVAGVILLALFAPYVTPFPRHAGPFTDFAHAKIAPGGRRTSSEPTRSAATS